MSGIRGDMPDGVRASAWTLITVRKRHLAYRYLEVMYRMNRAVYASEPADLVVSRMLKRRHEYYLYWHPQFELVIGFCWRPRRRLFELKSMGFEGRITPADALELFIEKFYEFMRRRKLQRICAVRPYAMESREILELYELVMKHPAVDIRGTHRLFSGTYLRIGCAQATPASTQENSLQRA